MESAQTMRHLLPSPGSIAQSVQAIRVTPETFGERRRVKEGPSCCCPRVMLDHGSGRWYISPLFNLGQRLRVESGQWGAGSGEAGMRGTGAPAGRGSSRGPWPTFPQSVPRISLPHWGQILHHRSGTALLPGTFPVCLFPCLASVSVLLPDGDGPLRFPALFQLAGVGYKTGCERGDPWATLCLPLACFSEPPRPALSRGASISRAHIPSGVCSRGAEPGQPPVGLPTAVLGSARCCRSTQPFLSHPNRMWILESTDPITLSQHPGQSTQKIVAKQTNEWGKSSFLFCDDNKRRDCDHHRRFACFMSENLNTRSSTQWKQRMLC